VPRHSSSKFPLVCVLVLGFVLGVGTSVARAGMNNGRSTEPAPKLKTRSTQPTFAISAGLDGDVFPVFANYASFQSPRDRDWGTVTVTVANSTTELLRDRITVEVLGWSDQEIQIAEVGAGQLQKFLFAPSFLPRLYQNRELTPATARVTISDGTGKVVFVATTPLRIRSAEDMYWGVRFKYAPFIASWVTPHDSRVEALLARAKEFMPGRRMPGYEQDKSTAAQKRSTTQQVAAIYRALQQAGVSYVKSSGTFGAAANSSFAERVRLPRNSLQHVSANCIDGAVLYASLFENLGLESVVLLVPGHAYVGVRLAENSGDYLYLETALTGRATFQTAVQAAQRGLARYSADKSIRIPIREARQAGIFPLPSPQRAQQEVETSGLK
jgi:hypothetical protein